MTQRYLWVSILYTTFTDFVLKYDFLHDICHGGVARLPHAFKLLLGIFNRLVVST